MKEQYKDVLFSKGYLVADACDKEQGARLVAETLATLDEVFGIQVANRCDLAGYDMVRVARRNLGDKVPEAFYRGFPKTARELSSFALYVDQMLHYATTYGAGDFSQPGHSLFEGEVERTPLAEQTPAKRMGILTEDEAVDKLKELVASLLAGTRPLSDSQFALVAQAHADYGIEIERCGSKDTAARLIVELEDPGLARLLMLPDVIRLVEELQFRRYERRSIKKLNLRNRDRRLIAAVLDSILAREHVNEAACYEKRALWCGLLHHLHYVPKNDRARAFVRAIRSSKTRSVYASFEQALGEGKVPAAVEVLKRHKGATAVLRNLDYLLSRCSSEADVASVLSAVRSNNKIVLIQLLIHYASYHPRHPRDFKFVKFGMLRVHHETAAEARRSRSAITEGMARRVEAHLRMQLSSACAGRLGAVYADESVRSIALPLQEGSSMGGVGTLPKGSRIPLPAGKVVRAFTYWERVDDIDLSCLALTDDGTTQEFSWRTMDSHQSQALTFSGDQTAGYHGGSEFFDVDAKLLHDAKPSFRYLVFCDNVYSDLGFDECTCRAGYMLRDQMDSGEVFEPKTVESSFVVNCPSRFAYLFALDLKRNEFVWLNVARDSWARVAGSTRLDFLADVLDSATTIDLFDFAHLLATTVVDDPLQADVVFSDRALELPEGVEQVRACDFDRVIELLNG